MTTPGEPTAVEVTPFIEAVTAAKAAGDDAEVARLIASSSDDDRSTFLAWTKRLWWIESESMAVQERLLAADARLAEMDAEDAGKAGGAGTSPPV